MRIGPQFFDVRSRKAALRTGWIIGLLLSSGLVAWLWIANRMPQLEPYAAVRNIAAGVFTVILMAIPMLRFRRQPGRMFVSGLTAWGLLTFTYIAMELHFSLLESRMGALQVFMLGAILVGFAAALQWVLQLCGEIRQRTSARDSQTPLSSPPRQIR